MRAQAIFATAVVTVLGVVAIVALDVMTTACGPSASSDPGDDAYMKVFGAQFAPGPMPSGSATGPEVLSINLVNSSIYPNFPYDPVAATLAPTATAAAVGLQGDVGYWLVVAGVPAFTTPMDPSLAATASFSAGIIPGQYTLVVQAADDQGNFGLPSTEILTATQLPPCDDAGSARCLHSPVTGQLVVTLTWDNDANLDLHVVDPAGQDLYWGEQSTQPPFMFQQVDGGTYGTIDYDSNANCFIDGLDQEDAVWKGTPPSGTYTVRVDAASLCGEPDSYWTVTATLDGAIVGQAQGVAVDADTRGSHGSGSGVTAFTFDVP